MNVEQALEWMKLFNEKIQEQKDYLSELDTPIGDGDHGGNMARGMAAVMENLEGKQFETSSDVFKLVSMQLLSKVGGASGPLYGSAFMGMAKADSNSKIRGNYYKAVWIIDYQTWKSRSLEKRQWLMFGLLLLLPCLLAN